jgi:hypothetical protein
MLQRILQCIVLLEAGCRAVAARHQLKLVLLVEFNANIPQLFLRLGFGGIYQLGFAS